MINPSYPSGQSNLHLDTYTDRSIAIACIRGREAVVSRFHDLLNKNNFTEQQWRVLRVLYDFEPIPSADLCRYCCIHKVSMARILKNLQERRLAVRTNSVVDQRAYIVSLTEEGRTLMSNMTPIATEIYKSITRDFGEEKAYLLLELLKELAAINSK